jgi:hypothetical protein
VIRACAVGDLCGSWQGGVKLKKRRTAFVVIIILKMIGRHKRNKAEEGLETSLNLANFSRFSVGCDYSGPLTLRLSRENNQEDSPQHHVPKHPEISSREKGKTNSLRDNLRLLEEKLAKASGQLKTAKIVKTVKKEQRSQMRQTFAAGRQPPFRLEICQ